MLESEEAGRLERSEEGGREAGNPGNPGNIKKRHSRHTYTCTHIHTHKMSVKTYDSAKETARIY